MSLLNPIDNAMRPYVWGAVVLAALLALAGAGWSGHYIATNHYQKVIAEHAAADAAADKNALRAAREAEHKNAADLAKIEDTHQQELTHAQETADRIIADLNAGTRQLRQRLAAHQRGLPGAGPATKEPDGAPTAGLLAEDAGFLVREAERADATVADLNACNAGRLADRAALER